MLEELITPVALIDQQRMIQNARSLTARLGEYGVPLRLHVKTCKSPEAALLCQDGNPGPITVASLEEASCFANAGFTDILYAVGITLPKLAKLAGLRRHKLKLILDSPEMATRLANVSDGLEVLIEIDSDGHRGGIAPESNQLLKIARVLKQNGHHLAGVLTHAGSAYELPQPSPQAFRELARRESRAVVKAARILEKSGYDCAIISMGSTPTAIFGQNFQGITEVRAGTHVFMDCVMVALGICRPEDMALSVLATIIGRKGDGSLVTDAGWSALSCDRGVDFGRYGYGLVADIDGEIYPGTTVRELNQEHGIIEPGYCTALNVGDLVRIYPAHACATANCFSKYHVMTPDGELVLWRKAPGR